MALGVVISVGGGSTEKSGKGFKWFIILHKNPGPVCNWAMITANVNPKIKHATAASLLPTVPRADIHVDHLPCRGYRTSD